MKTYSEDATIQGRLAEIGIKLKRVHEVLESKGLDALYIVKAENFAWITAGGNSIITRFVESGVVGILITKSNQYAITNDIEYRRFIDEEKLDQLGFEVITQPWYENKTLEHIRRIIGAGGKFSSDIAINGAEDANSLICKMQFSLTDNEIARYLHLGRVFSGVLEELLAEVRPGDMELDIVGRINNALWKRNIDTVLYLVAGDERIYKYRHCVATENRIKKYLMVSCNARYKGLITKITRFVHFGEPDAGLLKQYNQTVEVENRMIAATQIGVSDLVPLEAAIAAYEEFGYHDMWKVHHQGGPQGYTNGYYLITRETNGIVVPNQCYCYNPSITGTKTEDAFIVTAEGPVMITRPISYPKIKSRIGNVEIERPGILVI